MFGRWMHARERWYSERDTNRIVRPFEWGASFIREHVNGDDPRRVFEEHTREVMSRSEEFYALPEISDYRLEGDLLTWTSAVETPSVENNVARARFFPAPERDKSRVRRAVLILPQWNADEESHVVLCRVLNRLGISALRLTLPFHEARRPPELERADYLVSSNVGRTIQSVRQAVLDARAAVSWLIERGYNRIGIQGTSIGSCTAFLTYAHDERIEMGVFNHVSGYFADVVWHGISTRHVRAGFGDAISLEELREYWLPISPIPFIPRLLNIRPRPMRFIAARYDLTFPVNLSRNVIAETRRHNLPLDVAWLPCGHYTSGEKPWIYLDGSKMAAFFKKHL
ncbi:MAG: abhydrolase domain-containing 18 [Acidobacteria bacterium]|nr:abhydrolase domain-containing 18 [Acidobacteriota bacterium]